MSTESVHHTAPDEAIGASCPTPTTPRARLACRVAGAIGRARQKVIDAGAAARRFAPGRRNP